MATYKLAIGAVFKNERHALVEWIEHYLLHGAEHFYLIDDESTDGGAELLQPFIKAGLVDLAHESIPKSLGWHKGPGIGRMQAMHDKHVLPHIKDADWMLMCDLDEFIWSPHSVNLLDVLARFDRAPSIKLHHTLFGSNGHDTFPDKGIVGSYTRREIASPSKDDLWKYFVNGGIADVHGLFSHWPILGSKQVQVEAGDAFVFNHYCCQCREWWRTIKGSRGSADGLRHVGDDGARPMAEFYWLDRNDVEDVRLYEQNKPLIERLYG